VIAQKQLARTYQEL